jgi:hypothetical protein
MTMKEIPKVYDSVSPGLSAVTKFFHGAIRQSDSTIIIGLILSEKETGAKHLKLATLCIPPRTNVKGPQIIEHTIDKIIYVTTIGKGSGLVRARLLVKEPNLDCQYCLPTHSKMCDFAINDVIDPTTFITDPSATRLTYIKYTMSEMPYMSRNNKPCIQIIYKLDETSLNLLNSCLPPLQN